MAATLEGLRVCGAAHGNSDGGHADAAQTRPPLFIRLSELGINICLWPLKGEILFGISFGSLSVYKTNTRFRISACTNMCLTIFTSSTIY